MKNEQKFINECIRIFLGKTDYSIISKMCKFINFTVLSRLISEHEIEGIFYKIYLEGVFDKINLPSAEVEIWKKVSGKNLLLNAMHEKEALRIVDKLTKNKIDYFYIKGFSTRKRCHDYDFISTSTDIDFFIKKEDYEKVKNILISDGYTIPMDYYINTISNRLTFDEFEKRENEICFVKKEEALRYIIDLQWDIINNDKTDIFHKIYNLDVFYQFKVKDTIEVAKKKVNVFPIELEFINMAFHYAFHHGFIGIKWLIEICLFIKKYENDINFDYILKNSNYNLRKILGIILMLAFEYNFRKKIGKEQKIIFCIDKFLPYEYLFYKSMTIKLFNRKTSGKLLRYIKILLPYKLSGRFAVINENLKFIMKNNFKK